MHWYGFKRCTRIASKTSHMVSKQVVISLVIHKLVLFFVHAIQKECREALDFARVPVIRLIPPAGVSNRFPKVLDFIRSQRSVRCPRRGYRTVLLVRVSVILLVLLPFNATRCRITNYMASK